MHVVDFTSDTTNRDYLLQFYFHTKKENTKTKKEPIKYFWKFITIWVSNIHTEGTTRSNEVSDDHNGNAYNI